MSESGSESGWPSVLKDDGYAYGIERRAAVEVRYIFEDEHGEPVHASVRDEEFALMYAKAHGLACFVQVKEWGDAHGVADFTGRLLDYVRPTDAA